MSASPARAGDAPRAAFPLLPEPGIAPSAFAPPAPPPPAPPREMPAPASDARPAQDDRDAQGLRWIAPGAASSPSVPHDQPDDRAQRHRVSDDWMLSLQAVTHAPLDVGLMIGIETPPGLRLSAGYGIVPGAYESLVTQAAGNASGADPLATSLITKGFQGGHTWRVAVGLRPFSSLGFYVDAGYARVALAGALDSAEVPRASAVGIRGGYNVNATLDMWLVELGYEAHLGDHVVLGIGAGVMGTLAAHTRASLQPGSSGLPPIAASTTSTADRLLEQHGYLPTLTLRLGADFI